MKRHISIFALLLCVFAAVGQGAGYYYVAANVPCTLTQSGKVGEMPFDSRNSTSGGYYDSANAENSFTKITYGIGLTLTAGNKEGYRFNGWYSHEKGWTEISKVTVESAGESVSKEKELTDGAVASAGRWTPGAGWDIPVVFAKYVKVWTVTTDVNPAGADAGTVTGGGTVDNGGSVTLTATANKGYEFSKWSDGNTENPRTIGNITGSVTYTAVFTKKTVNLTLDLKEGVSRIGYKTTSGASYAYVTEDTVLKAEYGSTYYLIAEASGGWSFNGSPTKSETFSNITSAKTFTPAPEPATYTVTIDAKGGSGGSCPSYTVSASQQTKTITLPTRTGYSIASSWDVSGATGGTPTVSGNTLTILAGTYGNLTLTPTWTAVSYTITYSGLKMGSTHNNPTSYTIETPAIVFSAASDVSDSKFLGWSPASISSGSTGNKTVTANYLTKIQKPSVTVQLTYSGSSQACVSSGLNNMQVSGNTATVPGLYTATFTPNSGYCWSDDGSTSAHSVGWKIVNAEISNISAGQSGSLTYNGQAQAPAINASATTKGSQTAVWKYSKTAGSYAAQVPTFTDAGTYTVYYEVSAQYHNPKTGSFSVTIGPSKTASVTLSKTQFGYTGKEQGPTVTCVNCAEVSGSVKTGTEVGTYYVKAKPSKNYAWSDGSTDERNFEWRIVEGHFSATIAPGEGGSGGSTVNYSTSPNPLGTQIQLPTRKGYEIESWTASGFVGTAPTISGTTLTIPARTAGNFTMTPTWKAKKYTLTIHLEEDEMYNGYKGDKTGNYTLPDPLIFGETNLNEIAVAVKKDDADFKGYFLNGMMIYDAQGRNVKDPLGEYWTNNYPIGTYCHDGHLTLDAHFDDPREHYEVTVTAAPAEAGTADPSGTATYVEGSNIVLKATANTGYSFWHWTKNGAEVSTDKEYQLTVTANAEYVAVFTGNVYTVSLKNAVLVGTPTKTVVYGEPYGEFQTFENPGMHITGWYYTDDYRPEDLVCATTRVSKAEDHKLYALWEEIKEFTVTFADPEGGNESTSVDRTKGQSIGNAPDETKSWKRDGYWRNNDLDWDPPLTTLVTSNMTVTAKWTSIADVLDCPNLTFNVSAGPNWKVCTSEHVVGDSCMRLESSTGSDHLSVHISEAGTLSFNWRVSAGTLSVSTNNVSSVRMLNGPAEKWNAGEKEIIKISGPCDLTFYGFSSANTEGLIDNVSWTPGAVAKKHTVTFVDPSGTIKTNVVQEVEEGAAAVAPAWTSDKFDPTVCGWDKDFSKVMSNITVNAVWACRVEFVDRETATTNRVAYGDSVEAPEVLEPYPGYTHTGWSPDLPEHVESNLVLTAVWTPNDEYTVTYRPGTGISGSTMTQSEKKDIAVNLYGKDKAYGRTGYSQDGWATADGGTKVFEFCETYDRNVSTNLYPCWTNNRYTVTFNPNGGSVTPAPKVVIYDKTYGELPSPGVRAGYEFTGWALTPGDAVTAATIVKTAAGHELVAQWTQDLGPLSAALDCTNLRFESSVPGWLICEESPHKGASCLRSETSGAELTATITESGTLTFWWKGDCEARHELYVVTNNVTEMTMKLVGDFAGWTEVKDFKIVASTTNPVELKFACSTKYFAGYFAIDYVTWTPDRKEPEYADTDTPVTGFSMADGKIGFSFVGDGSSTYHILGTNDVTAPWKSWPFVREIKAGETQPVQIDIKADEPKMFYRIRALK